MVHAAVAQVDRTVEALHEILLGDDVDDAASAGRVVLGRGVGHDLDAVDGRAVGGLEQDFQLLAGEVGGTAVEPYGHCGAVELDVALEVDSYAGGFAEQVGSVAAFGGDGVGDVHDDLVQFLLYDGAAGGDHGLLQHLGVGLEEDYRVLLRDCAKFGYQVAVADEGGQQPVSAGGGDAVDGEAALRIGGRTVDHRAVGGYQGDGGELYRLLRRCVQDSAGNAAAVLWTGPGQTAHRSRAVMAAAALIVLCFIVLG